MKNCGRLEDFTARTKGPYGECCYQFPPEILHQQGLDLKCKVCGVQYEWEVGAEHGNFFCIVEGIKSIMDAHEVVDVKDTNLIE